MNTLALSKNKNLVYMAMLLITLFTVIGSIFSSAITVAAEGGDVVTATNSTNSADFSLSNMQEKTTSTITDIQKTVVALATVFGGLAMIVVIVLILFTHDDRKIQGYIKICVTIGIALVVIYLINGGAVISLIKQFAESLGGSAN